MQHRRDLARRWHDLRHRVGSGAELGAVPGVSEVDVDLASGQVLVTSVQSLTEEQARVAG